MVGLILVFDIQRERETRTIIVDGHVQPLVSAKRLWDPIFKCISYWIIREKREKVESITAFFELVSYGIPVSQLDLRLL